MVEKSQAHLLNGTISRIQSSILSYRTQIPTVTNTTYMTIKQPEKMLSNQQPLLQEMARLITSQIITKGLNR